MCESPRSSLDGRLLVSVQVELVEDDGVFGHGAQRADQPREVLHKVFLFDRVQ